MLDLQSELALGSDTVAKTQQLFDEMQAEAKPLGAQVVELEKALGDLFSGHSVDETALPERVDALAGLMGQLRVIHLRAHIRTAALLTPSQIERYQQLRGYAAVDAGAQTGGAGGGGSSMVDVHAHHHGQ